jgi:hypothetical protein
MVASAGGDGVISLGRNWEAIRPITLEKQL